MSQSGDMLKGIVMQSALKEPQPGRDESQLALIMQSLMLEDTTVARVLRGEIHEVLNNFNRLCVLFNQRVNLFLENTANLANPEFVIVFNEIKTILGEIRKQEAEIYGQLESYHEYVPYLLLLSPSTVLSNISVKEADAIWRKSDIMLMRSKLKSKQKGHSMDSRNFFDAIGIKLYLQYRRAIEAHTFDGLVREEKRIIATVSDSTGQGKRRRLF